MALSPGTSLGAYEIVAMIGAGGMGEVYRARDTRLNRDVAIKVLPDAFVHDAARLARFKREAQVLASLNHPHIAAIYGLEETPSGGALVLELVDGLTLADRIARGPIAIDEALPIARQIAEALEAAHEHGVIHRDLKPANVKLTADDKVKVLDFGLAKAIDESRVGRDFSRADMSMSPTITSPAMTMGGVILGTAAYMSPEQAKAKPVDKRADIWAFGCVLYEMLTGKRAFEGEDVSDTLAAILRGVPDWSVLPRDVPDAVALMLRRCLEKDQKRRVGDISAVLFVLNEPALITRHATPAPANRTRAARLLWPALSILAIALTTAGSWYLRAPAPREPERRLAIPLPQGAGISNVSIAPDGRRIVVSMRGPADIQAQLWVRSLDAHGFSALPGTLGSRTPFWSPDSRSIGFFADGKLKVIAASGGPPRELCDGTGLGAGGTWNRDGVILFGTVRVLRRVDASGGPCTDVTKIEGSNSHGFPMFLPDGDHYFYVSGGEPADQGVYVASLREPDAARRVLTDLSSVLVVSPVPGSQLGHVLFLRETVLMAQRFNFASLDLSGDPFQVASGVTTTASAPQIAAAISENGVLAYIVSRPAMFQLTWLDRTGKELEKVGHPAGGQLGVLLSPNDDAVVFWRDDAVWVRDLRRGVESSLGRRLVAPMWSPDGTRIVAADAASGSSGEKVIVRDITSGKEQELSVDTPYPLLPSDWSRDGKALVVTQNNPKTQADILAVTDPLNAATRKPVPFLATSFVESQAQLSPDGRWVAYTSNESGQYAVYVSAFPSGAGKRRVSSAEGREPRWRRDGRELYYLAGSSAASSGGRHSVMAIPVQASAADIDLGTETALFEFTGRSIVPHGNIFQYSPASNGRKFLVSAMAGGSDPALHVITNWQGSIK